MEEVSVTAPGSWRSLDVRPRYSERHVALLLPLALWGIEPDRPAAVPDFRKGGDQRPSDLPAMLVDMQRSWRHAWMTLSMRRAVYVHLALDLSQQEGAAALGLAQQTLSSHYRAGMGALLDHLNGKEL
jgi:hypothetical protein